MTPTIARIARAAGGFAFILWMSLANAEGAQIDAAAQPGIDDITRALSPIKTRGIRLDSAPPAGQASRPAPAIALDIRFKVNSAVLSDDAAEIVRRLAAALRSQQLAQFRFRIEGHTDATGNDAYNVKLSERRAEAVRAELIRRYGVPDGRLETVGLGKSQPMDPTDPNNPLNRRVRIVNLDG
jgi:outer membrane protein OmpA-like peptidoglycan-associated protein